MNEITKEQADKILHEKLHKSNYKKSVACYKGRWFDIRGLQKHEIVSLVTKIFGYNVNPDAMI